MKNLDLECAKLGLELGKYKDDEKLLTDSLSVLEEQGVYAFFLFLKARMEEAENSICEQCFSFLADHKILSKNNDVLNAIKGDLSADLDKLLFARDLLRQSLIYARYHAKASENERPKKKNSPEKAFRKTPANNHSRTGGHR